MFLIICQPLGEVPAGQREGAQEEGDRDDQEGPVGECLDLGASRKPKKGASYQEEGLVIPNTSAMGTPGMEGTGMSHWIGGGVQETDGSCQRKRGQGDSGTPVWLLLEALL